MDGWMDGSVLIVVLELGVGLGRGFACIFIFFFYISSLILTSYIEWIDDGRNESRFRFKSYSDLSYLPFFTYTMSL